MLTPLQVGSGDNFVLRVGPSRHPMATNLRNLALDGKRPVLVQYADPAQALLFPGRRCFRWLGACVFFLAAPEVLDHSKAVRRKDLFGQFDSAHSAELALSWS